MRIIKPILFFFGIFCSAFIYAQKSDANLFGDVRSKGEHLPFATVMLQGTTIGTTTDHTGHYMLVNLPEGEFEVIAQMVGFKKQSKKITLKKGVTLELNFELEEEIMSLHGVVITGTKTFKRQTESPVIVNVLEGKTLGMIQANTLSEGLCFQPGLRVETDCQTCNYSQLRMNGLGGGYSQILINSRPVFSPLTGLYGLEQIPSNLVDRIEVVRGGGSALYGSSAIGGTVNVITKIPDRNSFDVNLYTSLIGGDATDQMINANLNVLGQQHNSGVSIFASRRNREMYDSNGDNFSELPLLSNNSFGVTSFFKPTHNQKLEVNFSSLYEYRYGGEMVDKAAFQAQQSEERTHNILMGGLDYEIDFNDDHSAFIFYTSAQRTKRDHYTGIIPDEADTVAYHQHFLNPPYGKTLNTTFQAGVQVNHKIKSFIKGTNTLTLGGEFLTDKVDDEIVAYHYKLDQVTRATGVFVQSDWDILKDLTLLTGIRADKHNLVDVFVFNPRISALYKLKGKTQFRVSWSKGFRAPQAFDSDMHIAFAGGGVSRVRLADNLKAENSSSFSASVNYDKATEKFIAGFTLEAFYTNLNDAFVLEEAGSDEFGLIFEKRNASSSTVKGATIEGRWNYNRKIQVESGYTIQSSTYQDPVRYSDILEPTRQYLRTPDHYGYYTLSFMPSSRLNASFSGVFTGSMKILHTAGSPENTQNDKFVVSESFFEHHVKISYLFEIGKLDTGLELSGGIKNILNTYQDDFDTGKNRDSNYIYGPAMPRTFFIGLKFKSLEN
jgi:outer membrane receptor for ferrienterochelin and colicins